MSDNADRTIVTVGSAELIASIPSVLGFCPAESIVVIGLDYDHASHANIRWSARIDLDRTDHTDTFHEMLIRTSQSGATGVILVFITSSGRDTLAERIVQYCEQFGRATAEIARDTGVPELEKCGVFWTPKIAAGSHVYNYDTGEKSVLPDPTTTHTAAIAQRQGRTVFGSRDALHATLRPTDPDALQRCEKLLAQNSDTDPNTLRAAMRAAIESARTRTFSPDDTTIALLARALEHPRIDSILSAAICDGLISEVRAVCTVLARTVPAPFSSYAKTYLAVCAYLNQDGVLAAIALNEAIEEHPTYELPRILCNLITTGVLPDTLTSILAKAAHS